MTGEIELCAGPYYLVIEPHFGGSISRFTFKGSAIFRSDHAAIKHVFRSACWAMVPFANRIANGVFQFQDEIVRLPVLAEGAPHALHGEGWRSSWAVVTHDGCSAVLALEIDTPGWPWRCAATQTYALDDSGLTISLEIANKSDCVMPVSFGFHPAFPAPPDAIVEFAADGMWAIGEDNLPGGRLPSPINANGVAVAELPPLDNCFFGWDRKARITMPSDRLAIDLTAGQRLDKVHVYRPTGADFICIEPVSAMPDAFNRIGQEEHSGFDLVRAGEKITGAMKITAFPLGA